MASNYGLTGSGFNLPPMEDLIQETKKTFKNEFGEDFNTESNSVADKLISIFNEREYQLWLLMGSVYYAQTMQGAEGIYLDDLLSKRGIYRNGKTRSTGQVQLTIDSTIPYNMIYSASAYTIDNDYRLSNDVQVAGNIFAQVIRGSDLSVGSYRLQIQNINDQSIKTMTYQLTATTGAPVIAFFSAIKDFIVENTILSNRDKIIIDSVANSIHIGYDSNKNLIGLSSRIDFRTQPLAGTRTVTMDVRAIEPGLTSRDAFSVRGISPVPAGFLDLTNLIAFTPGSDVESDNEYRLRAIDAVNTGKATRAAILSALLNKVEGIEKVRIFANNTDKTNSVGVPPYSFMPVVYGGNTAEISQVLYDTIAGSNNTSGSTFYNITTEDDQVETIWHTKAQARNLSMRISYRGRPLSVVEETTISNSLITAINGTIIAGTLYNVQLVGTVISSTASSRFTQVFVEIKNVEEPESSYVGTDVSADVTEVFALSAENIEFRQIV